MAKFNWERANKHTRIKKEMLVSRLANKYGKMAESKWFFYVHKHKCKYCGKEIVSKYPQCYSCYKKYGKI